MKLAYCILPNKLDRIKVQVSLQLLLDKLDRLADKVVRKVPSSLKISPDRLDRSHCVTACRKKLLAKQTQVMGTSKLLDPCEC